MPDRNINPHILNEIKKQCNDDNAMRVFLYELVYEEAKNKSGWHWKDTYREMLDKQSSDWSNNDEN